MHSKYKTIWKNFKTPAGFESMLLEIINKCTLILLISTFPVMAEKEVSYYDNGSFSFKTVV
jgi:hypothetical protein